MLGSFGEVIGSCGVFFDINPREVVLCRRIHPFLGSWYFQLIMERVVLYGHMLLGGMTEHGDDGDCDYYDS